MKKPRKGGAAWDREETILSHRVIADVARGVNEEG